MAGSRFSSYRVPLHGVARAPDKGRGSVAAPPRRLKLCDAWTAAAQVPYPQKLWTTLWTDRRAGLRSRCEIAYLLPWSKNNQAIFACDLNNLHTSCPAAWPLWRVIRSFSDAP